MKTILLIDDSQVDRKIAAATLKRDFKVIEAEDGHSGLQKLGEDHVDIILLDVNMPGLGGPETLREIRRLGLDTPVILLTGEVRTNIISEMMSDGIANYIVKPVSPAELSAKIHQAFGTSPEEQELKPIDVLLIDDMKSVHTRLESLLPAHFRLEATEGPAPALILTNDKSFDIIVVDMEIPGADSISLAHKLKERQPQARLLGLFMRDVPNIEAEVSRVGLDGYISKPFQQAHVVGILESCPKDEEGTPLQTLENIMTTKAFSESEQTQETEAHRVIHAARDASRNIAAACFESVILDLNVSPPQAYLNLILGNIQSSCSNLGLDLKVVAPEEVQSLVEIDSLQLFDNQEAASAAN